MTSGIAFHGAAASGDVDIQQRLEEHLAHCALLTAVAQDKTVWVGPHFECFMAYICIIT